MRWIYLSPHLDDAVLSAGGFLFEQALAGTSIEIWNLFSGFPSTAELSPLAKILHEQWGTETARETILLRRDEDLRATHKIGATSFYFDHPDCIYRLGPDGEPLYLDVFVDPHPVESRFPDLIVEMITPLLKSGDRILCQLAIGNHVDHILTRRAAERLARPLWFSADLPYTFHLPKALEHATAGMQASHYLISEAGLKQWIEAILAYKSQLGSLFESNDQIQQAIRNYCQKNNGFTLWQFK